ncbi:hypothetical protein POM88_042178 [Heracleum sosnowskyi]|uniref:Uncharacterized protein n=1 Tax=Heracleum sosnowskyi TaxID=360622 RepID=A0AAD8MBE4_9APIA|nr:hypothetical protein POM88_042178 [Heracleum sosnowskyi]
MSTVTGYSTTTVAHSLPPSSQTFELQSVLQLPLPPSSQNITVNRISPIINVHVEVNTNTNINTFTGTWTTIVTATHQTIHEDGQADPSRKLGFCFGRDILGVLACGFDFNFCFDDKVLIFKVLSCTDRNYR